MAAFVKGDIVIVPFPFTDLSSAKRRPALVVQILDAEDVLLCQITSKHKKDDYSISLNDTDFSEGKLNIESFLRPNRLVTIYKNIILYKLGQLKEEKYQTVLNKIIDILRQ